MAPLRAAPPIPATFSGSTLGTAAGPEGPGLPRHLPATLAKAATKAEEEGRMELMLDPAELGKVRFELTSTSTDRVQVNVVVERPETLDLLRRNMDSLRAEFRDAGFDAATLSFSQWGKGGDAEPEARAPLSDTLTEPMDGTPIAPQPTFRNMSGHGLDLRL